MPNRATKRIYDHTIGDHNWDDYDLAVISHPLVQRLRRINQSSAQAIFPLANHKRFEHSLGVMNLGSRALEHLLSAGAFDADKLSEQDKEIVRRTVRYACLLHDIGHTPLSHVCEPFLQEAELLKELSKASGIDPALWSDIEKRGDLLSSGELMTCVLFLDYVRRYIDGDRKGAFLVDSGIQLRHLQMPRMIDANLFCRMVLGINTGARRVDRICPDLLNHKAHDVDKLDYVWRDSRMTNPNLVAVDVDRLIEGFTAVGYRLAISTGALGALVSLIYSRDIMYGWVYNHHTVAYTDELIKRYVSHLQLAEDGALGRATQRRLAVPRRQIVIPTGTKRRHSSIQELYFSKQAIFEGVDDTDIWTLLKANRMLDATTISFYAQLFDRQHLKALYKTPVEYKRFLGGLGENAPYVVAGARRRKGRSTLNEPPPLEQYLHSQTGLTEYELMVIDRPFKLFSPGASSDIWIEDHGRVNTLNAVMMARMEGPFAGLLEGTPVGEQGQFRIPFIFFNESKVSASNLEGLLREYHVS